MSGAARLERSAKGFLKLAALRASTGGIPERYAGVLLGDEDLAKRAVRLLLEQHFEPSLHSDVLAAVRLEPEWFAGAGPVAPVGVVKEPSPSRDPAFREAVLAAYDQRCAATGFQAMIGGTLFALEAAHVHWNSKGGPSRVTNGIALNQSCTSCSITVPGR